MQVPEMQSTARGSRASSAMQRPIHCSKLQSPYLDVQAMRQVPEGNLQSGIELPVCNSVFCLSQFHLLYGRDSFPYPARLARR